MFGLNNPWFVAIIGETLATTFERIALYYMSVFGETENPLFKK